MAKTICWIPYKKKKKKKEAEKWWQGWKSFVLINEQCCIWKNIEKRKKFNWCKACKQQRRLFKMDIQTKLYVT